MAALGFKHNKATFRRLATAVPGDVLAREGREDPARAYALLLGVAGLLPAPDTGGDEETRLFVRALWDRWWKQRDEWDHYVLQPEAWRLDGIRPANHPRRRLAAAVSLFSNQEPFVERLSGLPRYDPREWSRRVAELFADRSSLQYWRRRLSLGGKIADTSQAEQNSKTK